MDVIVYELEKRLDGTVGLGNSEEVPVEKAKEMIKAGTHTSGMAPRGKIPVEWGGEPEGSRRSKKGAD